MSILSKITALVGLAALVAAGVWFWGRSNHAEAGKYDSFAQCLAAKGVTMYGAQWCPHCQNEKRAFGDAFRFVPYVECPASPQKCLELGIRGYPTWILPGGEKLEGEQGLTALSRASGCLLRDFAASAAE